MSSSSFTSTASPTLDNIDNFLRFCNPDDGLQVQFLIKTGSDGIASLIGDDGLQVQLRIKAGSDSFASLIVGLCSQQGRISMMIS
ncbi:unnamed protein product [Schistocephalus solidus]|uniref:Type VI secretion system tip protein VgrG n=1 Tax=Schistocephalus solidus TaxID=70667 RepID=A0A183TES3_SCHSO|nr:unnamed protein product [Schistocephalus solidus]